MIDMSMINGRKEITLMHNILSQFFSGYDPEKTYDVICTCQEYCESEGQFPAKMKQNKNRSCVLCDKYNLKDSRRLRTNYEGTRNVWVHPEMKACVLSGADNKNIKYQSNVKSSYCRYCKCCHGNKGDEGGWCKALLDNRQYNKHTHEKCVEASAS